MKSSRFAKLVAAFGGDPRRWPRAEQDKAMQAAAENPDLLRAEMALDAALDLYQTPLDVDRFIDRAMALAPSSAGVVELALHPRAHSNLGWALAACALVGVVVGFGAGSLAPSDEAVRSVAAAFGVAADTANGETDG